MTRFIHFSGLPNPGKSLPPEIGLARDMNTEKIEFHELRLSNQHFKYNLKEYPISYEYQNGR